MNWFIISENEHFGPYSEGALEKLYRSKDLDDNSLLWREGLDAPKSYRELFLEPHAQGENEDEAPPPLPPEALQPRTSSVEEPLLEHIPEFEPEKTSKKARPLKWFALFILLAVVSAAGVAGWVYYSTHIAVFSRPSKMGVADYERLKSLTLSTTEDNLFGFALAKDKSVLWMATNSPLSGVVELKLSSLPGKALSEDVIVANSVTVLEGKLAQFDSFEFEQGQRIIEGWYQVDVVSPAALETPFWMKWQDVSKRRLRYQDEVLLTSMRKEQFEKALERFNKKRKENENVFWQELEQKYRTVKAIASNIQSSLQKVFEKSPGEWELGVMEFEREYMENYGNFFTSFVIQNEQAYKQIEVQRFPDKNHVIAGYTRLSRLAKSLGAMTMESLEEMRSLKQSPQDQEKRDELKEKVDLRFSNLVNEVDEKIEEIDKL